MNLDDVSIIEILEGPKRVITDDFLGYVVRVKTNRYGPNTEMIFVACTLEEISKYKVGYTWME